MTITIEHLEHETEQALIDEAHRRGVAVSKIAVEVLGKWAHRKTLSGYAKFAHVPGSVAEFLQEKHEEAETEINRTKTES